MEICGEAERRPGLRVKKWWWKKEGIELAGERAEATTAEAGDTEGGGWYYE